MSKRTAARKPYKMINLIIAIVLIVSIALLVFNWYSPRLSLKDHEALKDLMQKGYVIDGGRLMSCGGTSMGALSPFDFEGFPTAPPPYIPSNCKLCTECSEVPNKCVYYLSCKH